MHYRILPTNTRAMPLECSPKEFAGEYLSCMQDSKRSTGSLQKMIDPFIIHWDQMLQKSDYPKDINYISLCHRLSPEEEPFEILEYYVSWANKTSSVKEELEMLFFERLRNLRYFPKVAAPAMAEYVIALDFRRYLKDRIISSTKYPIDIPSKELTFNSLVTEDNHPDHLLLKNLGIDAWETYLLNLLILGKNTTEISALTQLPRKTFSSEETEIWLKLKQKWQAP